jgi:hypothetical protein
LSLCGFGRTGKSPHLSTEARLSEKKCENEAKRPGVCFFLRGSEKWTFHNFNRGSPKILNVGGLQFRPNVCSKKFSLKNLQSSYSSFGNFLTKKREISRTFALKKCELLSSPRFGQFCQKCELVIKVRAISRF